MDRLKVLKDDIELRNLYLSLLKLKDKLGDAFQKELNRLTSFNDLIFDRWDKAKKLNFGENTSVYDNVLVIGEVTIGKECWVGPEVILDGSGGLNIGDYCTISAGVHIYSHDNVKQTLSSKKLPIERKKVNIGANVYIGPHAVIAKGVNIGNYCVVGAKSFVKQDIPANSIAAGIPAKVIGEVFFNGDEIVFKYFN